MKMTARTAKWMESVVANCEANTGRTLPAWIALAKKARLQNGKGALAWGKTQGLSMVYQNAIADALFPSEDDEEGMLDAQYAGPKAALRPIYDAVVKAARTLGSDVEIMTRKSQVTLSRGTSFAVVRPATKDRIDLALKLHGVNGTRRLAIDEKAAKSDPSHVVAVTSVKEVDKELVGWLAKAYARAKPGKTAG